MQSINDSHDTPYIRITALKKHTHKDNIHLTHYGYKKIAYSKITAAVTMMSRQAPPYPAQDGPTIGIEKVFWHGFTITTGYSRSSRATPYNSLRGRGAGTHPYRCQRCMLSCASHATDSSCSYTDSCSKFSTVPTPGLLPAVPAPLYLFPATESLQLSTAAVTMMFSSDRWNMSMVLLYQEDHLDLWIIEFSKTKLITFFCFALQYILNIADQKKID